jgi:hypothetical protein
MQGGFCLKIRKYLHLYTKRLPGLNPLFCQKLTPNFLKTILQLLFKARSGNNCSKGYFYSIMQNNVFNYLLE